MSTISSPTYDPTTTATNLANAYVAPTKAILDKESAKANATDSALTTLGNALSAFQTALSSLGNSTTSVAANSATVSNSTIATATASSTAVAGTYSFYVQQLATAGQVSYNVADSAATNAGSMNVMLADGSSFQVDLANADANHDGVLSAQEVAAAVNAATNNDSRITASTMTINGQQQLVLNSNNTGAANAVAAIDTSGLGDPGLAAALSAPTVLTTAKDAIIQMGGETVQQASNTFSVIDNVKFTITGAQAAGANPVTLTVAPDNSTTANNVQSFVNAYNTLMGVFSSLTAPGDHTVAASTSGATDTVPTPTSEDAAFYNDAGVTALQDRLASALRAATGGVSLINFGISANKDGTLSLDTGRLNKAIAANPGQLGSLFGKAGVGIDSGVLGSMNKLANSWTGSTGYIASRRDVNTRQEKDITNRQTALQAQFTSAYQRYLAQFTALQQLQSTMTNTSNMFTAMFSPNSSS